MELPALVNQFCFGTWCKPALDSSALRRFIKGEHCWQGRVGGWETQTMTTIIYKVAATRIFGVGIVNKKNPNPRFPRIVLAQYWALREPLSDPERFPWWDERFRVCRCQNWEVLPGWVIAAAIKLSLGSIWRFILTSIRWPGLKYKSTFSGQELRKAEVSFPSLSRQENRSEMEGFYEF